MTELFIPNGTRVALDPATDDWARGDRYGEIVGQWKHAFTPWLGPGYRVKLDKSGKVRRIVPELFTVVIEE